MTRKKSKILGYGYKCKECGLRGRQTWAEGREMRKVNCPRCGKRLKVIMIGYEVGVRSQTGAPKQFPSG